MKAIIHITNDKCIGCGLCEKVCSSKVIKMKGNTPFIAMPESCSSCGHCGAICPELAIQAENPDNPRAFKISTLDQDLSLLELLLSNKRSTRAFKPDIPDRATLEKLVYYAEKAPSSTNNRHRKYIVVTDKTKLALLEKAIVRHFRPLNLILNPLVIKVAGLFAGKYRPKLKKAQRALKNNQHAVQKGESPIFKAAPCVILIAAPKTDIQAKDDCIIAQQYMMLYAQSLGIGSCIIGYAQVAHRSVERLFNLPRGYRIYSVGTFGYPIHAYRNEIRYLNHPDITWE